MSWNRTLKIHMNLNGKRQDFGDISLSWVAALGCATDPQVLALSLLCCRGPPTATQQLCSQGSIHSR